MITANQKELASILGITTRRIRQLRDQGLFEYVEDSKKYNLPKCVQEYINFKTKEEMGNGTSLIYEREKAEHEKIKKETAKLKLKLLKKELHETSYIESFLSDMLLNFKKVLLAIPSKLAVQVQGEKDLARIKQLLTNEMMQALDELAEFDPDEVSVEDLLDDEEEEDYDE